MVWGNRLIGITGSRGTGKTTMLLQHIKNTFKDRSKALYVSLDNIWFTKNSLIELVNQFYAFGGTHLFVDEVHRYHLYGLSFREFLTMETNIDFPRFTLEDIICNHMNIATEITGKIKVLPEFKKYLEYGHYPFYREGATSYSLRLQNIVNTILDNDLPSVEKVEYNTLTSLSAEIETNRVSAIKYLGYLQKAGLIKLLAPFGKGMNLMNKPEKIYLDNTNLIHSLAASNINEGNLRETFFANQCSANHKLTASKQGDFVIDDKYIFEVGGKGKNYKQIQNPENSFIAMDNIETGFGNKIPLWLFGFNY